MKQIDISMEQKREYGYLDRPPLTISKPLTLFVTEVGTHRVKDVDGWVHYVPSGWATLKWLPKTNSIEIVA